MNAFCARAGVREKTNSEVLFNIVPNKPIFTSIYLFLILGQFEWTGNDVTENYKLGLTIYYNNIL